MLLHILRVNLKSTLRVEHLRGSNIYESTMKEYPINQDNLYALSSTALRWRCDLDVLTLLSREIADLQGSQVARETPESLNPEVTEDARLSNKLFFTPQEAEAAIRLGLALDASGYHIFVSGPSGSGKTSAIKSILASQSRPHRARRDFVYLHNFEDPDRPRLCTLPQGEGRLLKRRLIFFVDSLAEIVLSALHSTRLDNRRSALLRQLEDALREALEQLERDCRELGFVFVQAEEGFGASEIKVKVGRRRVLSIDEWAAQVHRGKLKGHIEEKMTQHESLTEHLHSLWDELSRLEWELNRHIAELELEELQGRIMLRAHELFFGDTETAHAEQDLADTPEEVLEGELNLGASAIKPTPVHEITPQDEVELTRERAELYAALNDEITRWLNGLMNWMDDHLEELKHISDDSSFDFKELRILRANVVHEAPSEPPLIYESSPTLINLLGTIERSGEDNHSHLDFGDIRSGSLLKANGGILVVNANDLSLEGSSTWRFLLRALKKHRLEIQSPDQLFASGGSPIKPSAIPLDVKVIAIGDDELYRTLFLSSEDFRRVFKVKAEFDDSLPNSKEGLRAYVRHAMLVQREEQLKPLSLDALGLWCEYGTRLSGRRDRLSTQLGQLTDVLREANYYAVTSASDEVSLSHLRRALKSRFDRHRMVEDHLMRLISTEIIELTPSGQEIGVVHGLTVMDFGDHVCGYPCRVSATHVPGEYGIVSIERESKLSGRSHDKGTLNVSSYLRTRYLPDGICALHATLNFDQVHEEIDGDSASLAELIALISSLSQVPVNQSLAVTGAIDQRGHVQAVGGINEKIEGFFRACRERGLTGHQGVIIPRSTLDDLSLRRVVIDAVDQDLFHIWAVSHADEAVALFFADPETLINTSADQGQAAPRLPSDHDREDFGHRVVTKMSSAVTQRLKWLTEIAAQYRRGSSSS